MIDNKVLPDFFVIGAAKSGTTSVFDSLVKHPQVFLPPGKGTHYFSNDERFEAGLDWYSNYFTSSENYAIRGEQDVHYLYWSKKTTARLKELYGDKKLKFIAIFRDPVSRALSFYWQAVRMGAETIRFNEALATEEKRLKENWENLSRKGEMWYGYFRGGCYATLLQPFLDLFPDSQFAFFLQEDLRMDYSGVMKRVCSFLEVDDTVEFSPVISNPAALPRIRKFDSWMNNPSLYKNMIKSILPFPIRSKAKKLLRRLNMQPFRYEPMDQGVERELRSRYTDEIQRLETIIHRDLSPWLSPKITQDQ